MKCLSLWQPWAGLFVGGRKTIETRSWPVPRSVQMPFMMAVHAGVKWTGAMAKLSHTSPFNTERRIMLRNPETEQCVVTLGAILGTVEIYDCVQFPAKGLLIGENEFHFGDFTAGRYGWLARSFRPMIVPIPFKARQGLFDIDFVSLCAGGMK